LEIIFINERVLRSCFWNEQKLNVMFSSAISQYGAMN